MVKKVEILIDTEESDNQKIAEHIRAILEMFANIKIKVIMMEVTSDFDLRT